MMKGGEGSLSFATLATLIREGRAGEISGVRDIPDELNVSFLNFSYLSLTTIDGFFIGCSGVAGCLTSSSEALGGVRPFGGSDAH
jgi:hypothetical protein